MNANLRELSIIFAPIREPIEETTKTQRHEGKLQGFALTMR